MGEGGLVIFGCNSGNGGIVGGVGVVGRGRVDRVG